MRIKITGYLTVDDGYYDHTEGHISDGGFEHLRTFGVNDLEDVNVAVHGKVDPEAAAPADPHERPLLYCTYVNQTNGRVCGFKTRSKPTAEGHHNPDTGHRVVREKS